MIRKLSIKNFRCYEESTITFNGTSILVGKNNAGKSTMIEALKIISTVTRKYRTSRFVAPPDWLRNVNNFGIAPNVENMNISDRGIFHLYGNPPALIEVGFSEGCSIKAYIGEGLSIFAVIYDEYGCPIKSSKEAKKVDIPIIEVLPQISAVLDSEKRLSFGTYREGTRPKKEWIVCPPALIAATPVGARMAISFDQTLFRYLRKKVLPEPSFPVM